MELPAETPKTEEAVKPSVALNVSIPSTLVESPNTQLVEAGQIVGLVQTVMSDIDNEKNEIQEAYVNFAEMIFNAGDATGASKEALVNLLKLKSDLIDKKTRMLEMMVKVFNKEGQGPKTVNAHQHNDFHIHDKRKLFAELDNKEKQEKESK